MADLSAYRIFGDVSGDWYVAARRDAGGIAVLYEGHSRTGALHSIMRDRGVEIPTFETVERDLGDEATYEPVPSDWG